MEVAGLAAIRHLKRAQRLARESARAIASAENVDTVGHIIVRREEDVDSVGDLLRLSLAEHRELDVIVVAPIFEAPQFAETDSKAPNGAKDMKENK